MKTKLGGRKVIHNHIHEVIANVYRFMKREKDSNACIILRQILNEKINRAEPLSTCFSTPNKTKSDLDNFDLGIIRRTVNDFHQQYKEIP